MPYIGFKQGFITLGSTAHKMLKSLHEHGNQHSVDLAAEADTTLANASMTLGRLVEAGFVFEAGKQSKYRSGTDQSVTVYSLSRNAYIPYTPASVAQRCRVYRASRKRIPSVFAIGQRSLP
jgi:hypothetical protein